MVSSARPCDGAVELGEHLGRRAAAGVADAAQQAADLAHRRGGPHVVADDVADGQHRGAAGLQERVVPVAADLGALGGRHVADDDLALVRLRRLGEHAALQRVGQRALLAEQPGVLQRQPRAPADLDRRLHLGRRLRAAGAGVNSPSAPMVCPRADQRDDHRRAHVQPGQRLPRGRVGKRPLDVRPVHVRHHHRLAGAQHQPARRPPRSSRPSIPPT